MEKNHKASSGNLLVLIPGFFLYDRRGECLFLRANV